MFWTFRQQIRDAVFFFIGGMFVLFLMQAFTQ